MEGKKGGKWFRRAGVSLTVFVCLMLCACKAEREGEEIQGNKIVAGNAGKYDVGGAETENTENFGIGGAGTENTGSFAAGEAGTKNLKTADGEASSDEKEITTENTGISEVDKNAENEKNSGANEKEEGEKAEASALGNKTDGKAETQKTPEEILAEQPIDENHDAFLVEKGGKTGTVLVTAKREEGYTLVEFSVWDLENMEKPIQVIKPDSGFDGFGKHMVVDANFDGWMDFGYVKNIYDGEEYWEFWFWNEKESRFEERWLGFYFYNPVFFADTKIVSCLDEENGSGNFYHWQNGSISRLRSISTICEDNCGENEVYFTVNDNLDGVFVDVFSRSYEKDSQEWRKQWELWCDLDYHGEPGSFGDLLQGGIPEGTISAFVMNTGSDAQEFFVTAQPCREGDEPDTTGAQCWYDDAKIKFSVWNPADMSEPIQTMCKYVEEYLYQESYRADYEIVDANFDGYMDFAWICHTGNQPRFYYLWLWDEEQKKFVEEPVYNEISMPVADAQEEVIYGWARSSAGGDGSTTLYKWMDGHLFCMRHIFVWREFDEDDYTMTVEDRIDGEMVEVYRGKFQGFCEFDEERAKWCDLDYHGEE